MKKSNNLEIQTEVVKFSKLAKKIGISFDTNLGKNVSLKNKKILILLSIFKLVKKW